MAIVRVKSTHQKNPVMIGTPIFDDPRVSAFARGIFCTALSLAQSRGYDIKLLIKSFPDDPDDVYIGIMELRRLGYCKRKRVNDEVQFIFRETPSRKVNTSGQILKKEKNLSSLSERKTRFEEQGDRQIPKPAHEEEFIDWDDLGPQPVLGSEISQPSFLPLKIKKDRGPRPEIVSKTSHRILWRICYLIENDTEALTLNSSQRGRVADALEKLMESKADLSRLNQFEDWWRGHWRSKDKSGTYQPPTPHQVVEFWVQAMKAKTYKPEAVPDQPVSQNSHVNLMEMMKSKALNRNT